jgi:hypothetical protein
MKIIDQVWNDLKKKKYPKAFKNNGTYKFGVCLYFKMIWNNWNEKFLQNNCCIFIQ